MKYLNWFYILIKKRNIIYLFNLRFIFFYLKYQKLLDDKRYDLLKSSYSFYARKILINFDKSEINNFFSNEINDDYKYEFINSKLSNLKFNKYLYYELIFIYNFFRFFGSLRICYLVKRYVHNVILANYRYFINKNCELVIRTSIYEGKQNIIKDHPKVRKVLNLKKNRLLSIYFFSNQNAQFESTILLDKINTKTVNSKFKSLIKNKLIYIYGPNYFTHKKNNNLNITDKSLEIFTTFRKYTDSKLNNNNKICYLNSFKINNLYKELKKNLNAFSWIVVKNKSDYLKIKNIKKNTRISIDIQSIFENGSSMMIQSLIFDLLIYKPSKIFLTGIDFYVLGAASNYQYKDYDNKLINISHSVREHEIFENRMLIKKMFMYNLIDVDDDLKNILNINDEDFSKLLDHHYRKYIL